MPTGTVTQVQRESTSGDKLGAEEDKKRGQPCEAGHCFLVFTQVNSSVITSLLGAHSRL